MLSWLEKKTWLCWGIVVFGAIAIFYISSLTFGPGKPSILSIIYHISAFFCFALFLFIASIKRRRNYVRLLLILAVAVIYGILDEIHQFFVPGRSCSVDDFVLDVGGIAFASLIYLILILKKKNRVNTKKN
jgi:VanZ family protein